MTAAPDILATLTALVEECEVAKQFARPPATYRAAAEALPLAIEEIQKLRRASDFATEWHGRRWNRLRHLIHNEAPHLEETACCIMANGTVKEQE